LSLAWQPTKATFDEVATLLTFFVPLLSSPALTLTDAFPTPLWPNRLVIHVPLSIQNALTTWSTVPRFKEPASGAISGQGGLIELQSQGVGTSLDVSQALRAAFVSFKDGPGSTRLARAFPTASFLGFGSDAYALLFDTEGHSPLPIDLRTSQLSVFVLGTSSSLQVISPCDASGHPYVTGAVSNSTGEWQWQFNLLAHGRKYSAFTVSCHARAVVFVGTPRRRVIAEFPPRLLLDNPHLASPLTCEYVDEEGFLMMPRTQFVTVGHDSSGGVHELLLEAYSSQVEVPVNNTVGGAGVGHALAVLMRECALCPLADTRFQTIGQEWMDPIERQVVTAVAGVVSSDSTWTSIFSSALTSGAGSHPLDTRDKLRLRTLMGTSSIDKELLDALSPVQVNVGLGALRFRTQGHPFEMREVSVGLDIDFRTPPRI
jgi:hypothetical protein